MKWICPNCEYVYDEQKGHPREGWPAGTRFADIDPQWACPDCGVREQIDFVALTEPDDQHSKNTGKNTMGENA